MSPRVYPDEPAGPFPEPPLSFVDGEGREIEVRAFQPGEPVPEAVVAMYEAFDPADRAQGIPPSGEARIREWLADLFESGHNAVAFHGDRAAGHATLVPGNGRSTDDASDGWSASVADDERSTDGDQSPDVEPAQRPHELAIFVLQEYQQAGIGTRLLEGLLGHAAASGVRRVWLTVERWNAPAVNLYENVGFEVGDAATFELEMALRLDGDASGE